MVVKLVKNKKGQAFFEMIVFVPFMLYLFTLIITFGNSVNGAINQNKITRGAFYYINSHNSMGPRPTFIEELNAQGASSVGMMVVGYRKDKDGANSFSSCYRVNRVFGGPVDEECNEPPPSPDETNQIRIYTLYGVCTGVFVNQGGGITFQDQQTNSRDSCTNRGN